jgi:hypothetical protein
MHDRETAKAADIEVIFSMASMLVCAEEEAQAGLVKYQEQWADDQLDLPGLQRFMVSLHQQSIIAGDMLRDITHLIHQAISKDCDFAPQDSQNNNASRISAGMAGMAYASRD